MKMAAIGRAFAIRNAMRCFSQQAGAPSAPTSSPPPSPPPSVPGLSAAVVRPPAAKEGPAVPGDKSGQYKVPEYFCYNTMSYYEAEIEMEKFRLPQPSANK